MFTYDTLAAECLDRLDSQSISPGYDVYEWLKIHASTDDKLDELWKSLHEVPDWVDWDQISRGQDFFYRYAGPAIVALTFHSLLGGMGSGRVVETLKRTGGFGTRVSRRRLLDTFQFVLAVTSSLAAVQPGGVGFASAVRVRLLHAAVRRRILSLKSQRQDYFDTARYGVPISDLDSLGTVAAFSSALVWIGLARQGVFPRTDETADYMALWRWVGHLLGAPTATFLDGSLGRARTLMESILLAEEQHAPPGDTSRLLAANIVAGLARQPPAYASAEFLHAEARWLNGSRLSDALGIPRPPLFYTALVAAQCVFFMSLCYVSRSVSRWDTAAIARRRHVLPHLTASQTGGEVAMHRFQYVPSLEARDADSSHDREEQFASSRAVWHTIRGSGVEQRNLKALLISCFVVGLLAWLSMRNISVSFQRLMIT
jgi:hypothetical protein